MTAELTIDSKLSIPPQVMSRSVDDETVLLDLSKGIYFGLDPVGNRIWETIADGHSLGQAVTVITGEYEVNDARAQADVLEFAEKLLARGLLETG